MVYSVRDAEMELSDLSHVDTLWFCVLSQHFDIWSLGEKARQLRYLASALEAEWRHVPLHCREGIPRLEVCPPS